MFYILPPKGKVALHILENSVYARLEYLKLLEIDKSDSFSGNFEYLLENSFCDNIGHFALRLIAAASSELWPFWVRSEGLLFEQRLNQLSIRQVHRLFRNILKQLDRGKHSDSTISKALVGMSKHFLEPRVFNHIVRKDHSKDCQKYRCQVPFTVIPELVEHRKIDLHRGQGLVVCSEWKTVLLSLFRNFILDEKKLITFAANLVSSDPRLCTISKRIRGERFDELPVNRCITAKNIDAESQNFPPCMEHLHAILRDKHRLSHHARFQYSLFLKECGMKIDEAINYWREEYTKPHICQSGCTHNWQTDERKFMYSIRHLYGLEGGRKNYKTPNCKRICNDMPGVRYEGGCPFQQIEPNKIGNLLPTGAKEPELQKRLGNAIVRGPEIACSEFLKITHNLDDEDLVIHSPVQYYIKATQTK